MKIDERQIEVPWGHVAVKLWGDAANAPILCVHGIFDNAGAFDNLIPHLPQNFYYICIDLPSHGRSSQFPSFFPIHMVNFVIPVKLVMDHFNREQYILMGHSLGGQILMSFAHFYQERVLKIILLDALYLRVLTENKFIPTTKKALDQVFERIERPDAKPNSVYTRVEAVQKLIHGRHHGKMTREAAEPLFERAFQKIGEDRYVMNIDHKLKYRLYPSGTLEFMAKLHENQQITRPVLILLSTDRSLDQFFEPVYERYVQSGYEIHKYEGHHDVHATNPEMLAPLIVRFLLRGLNKV